MLGLSPHRREKRSAAIDAEGDGIRRPRKRERYTRVACESCKSRKVKCSGIQPCSRCSELNMQCTYQDYCAQLPPSQNTKTATTRTAHRAGVLPDASPQDLGQLLSLMKRTCDEIQSSTARSGTSPPPCPPLTRRRVHSRDIDFTRTSCPSNFIHSLNLARSALQQRGLLTTPGYNNESRSVLKDTMQTTEATTALLRAARPVLDLGLEAVSRYIATFKVEIYTVYPCISLELAQQKIDAVFEISSPPSANNEAEDTELDVIDVEIMKVVLAIAMLAENEENPLSSDLESHLIWNVDRNMKQDAMQVEDIIMSCLLAIYFLLKDEAVKAWRMAGYAAKSCLEIGMHRNSFFENVNGALGQKLFLKTLFCCAYDLDKRCSFFANLPWTLHEKAIDENVFKINSHHPYLSAMVSLSRIQPEIVELVNTSTPENKENDERAEYLDFRVQKLVESIPQNEFFPPTTSIVPVYATQLALQALFQLRTNHIRMLTHIQSLSSSEALAHRPRSAHTLISLAKSSVNLHAETIKLGGVGRLLLPTFDKLLMGSVSCMFLAASHDPEEYGPTCCNEFHTALDLLSQSSFRLGGTNSKIWCTLDDLRTIGATIQMPMPDRSQGVVPSSAEQSASIKNIQQEFVGEDFFGTFGNRDNDILAIFADSSSKSGDSSSNVGSCIDCMFDDSTLLPVTWNYS